MEDTARGKFEGGDTAWEEEKMKSYKNSEIRLVEIQEKLCNEVVRGQSQVWLSYRIKLLIFNMNFFFSAMPIMKNMKV